MTPPNGQQQQPITPNNAPQSRQELADDVAPIAKGATEVPVGQLGGFKFEIDLVKPTPAPKASASPAASSKSRTAAKAAATPSPTPSPSPTAAPTATPASYKGKPTPSPTPSGPRIEAKITIYPDGTQKPPGDADGEESHRVPVVKVVVDPSVDVSLYSLGAFVFTIPKLEQKEGRAFTVALYETRKNRKDRFVDAQLDATSDDLGAVRAQNAKDAHTLSKGHTYTVILFGDPLPETPSPYSPQQYPNTQLHYSPQIPQPQMPGFPTTPGANPFATPYPGQPGYPGQPTPYPGQPGYPYPGQPTPYPTPYHF
jgi:hypothetical protein